MKNDEPKSIVPSRMKRTQDINITKEQPLKARVRTVVFTNQNESSDHAIEEHKEIVSTNHVTAEEVSNLDEEIETDEATKTLEDGRQATVDELKELNLGTLKDPRLIYISALLTQEEEQDQLLGEYEVKKEYSIPYHKHASRLLDKFDIVKLSHVPRSANKMVDALASLTATLALGAEETMFVPVCNRWVVAPEEYEVEDDKVEEPLEVQIPSLRIAIQEGLTSYENDKLRLAELEALDEKILQAQQKLQCDQARITHAFRKKVRPRSFQVGDMVLAVTRHIITSRKTGNKLTSKWDGPYVVREVYTNGAYKIFDAEGLRVGPINGKFLKRYYS
uniref:RNase H type-1 domain-containing protein n=1 Tax=Chenopodium quinoa TaxID=63459 RepID=A0A803MTF5_CHEQI